MARITAHSQVIERGDLWVTDLRPGLGREVAKKRPTLVVSTNDMNDVSPTVIILPLSSQVYSILGPEKIFLSATESSLQKDSVILTYQIRAIDKKRLSKKIGSLSKAKMDEVEQALKLILQLS